MIMAESGGAAWVIYSRYLCVRQPTQKDKMPVAQGRSTDM
jgi:hypothetical protein